MRMSIRVRERRRCMMPPALVSALSGSFHPGIGERDMFLRH